MPIFPPPAAGGVIYRASDSLYGSSTYHGSRLGSRFILYGDGTFALQFSSKNHPFFEYLGRYVAVDSMLSLTFNADNGKWTATATLQSDSLAVRYSAVALMDDFVDGVYVRSSGP
ncbi:MAG TPA: hypothetical protein VNJ04_04505 [Gemmatimonadaceae bacterium]|nr:hypothetical protein [Gemmatimonadaceae bacterium]